MGKKRAALIRMANQVRHVTSVAQRLLQATLLVFLVYVLCNTNINHHAAGMTCVIGTTVWIRLHEEPSTERFSAWFLCCGTLVVEVLTILPDE